MHQVSRAGVKTAERPPSSGTSWYGGLRAWMNRFSGRGRPAHPSPGERPAPARGKLSEPVEVGIVAENRDYGGDVHRAADEATPEPPAWNTTGSESFAMTPAGLKIHRVAPSGMTVCGYSTLQMVMVEKPFPKGKLCGWCEAS